MSDRFSEKTLAFLGGTSVSRQSGKMMAPFAVGKVINAFAEKVDRVLLCVPESPSKEVDVDDLPLVENVDFFPMPAFRSAKETLSWRINSKAKQAYRAAIAEADLVFSRGLFMPSVRSMHSFCAQEKKPICYWVVGNPTQLLRSHRREGFLKDSLGIGFSLWWENQLRRGRRLADGFLLCNGQELADRFASPRTYATISATHELDDIREREDTCQGDRIRIATVCYIRPEKGIEYLLEAVKQVRCEKPWELVLVGSRDRYPDYQAKLDRLVNQLDIGDRVHWAGHASIDGVWEQLRAADLFVLPTLSEGTPRVLVEARASSVPVIASRVGGIPTSVRDGHDGLLVPPKDPVALAGAIERILEAGPLRRKVIQNGLEMARNNTVNHFTDQVLNLFTQN